MRLDLRTMICAVDAEDATNRPKHLLHVHTVSFIAVCARSYIKKHFAMYRVEQTSGVSTSA